MADNLPLRFLLATFARWVNRHQAQAIEYLAEENRVLKGVGGSSCGPDHPNPTATTIGAPDEPVNAPPRALPIVVGQGACWLRSTILCRSRRCCGPWGWHPRRQSWPRRGPRLVAVNPGLGRDLVRDRLAGWGERCVYVALSGAFRSE